MLKYIVLKAYPDAVEIWDQKQKDKRGNPNGQIIIWTNNNGDLTVGDEVTLHLRKVEKKKPDRYPGEPIGRSGVREKI